MKKSFRRVLTVAIAVLMIFTFVACASTEVVKKDVNKTVGDLSGKTVILHSNDVHGALQGYAYMSWLKNYYEGLGATVVLVDDGDFTSGNVYVSLSKGANAVTLMKEVGYDVVGLGNHELDFGLDQLLENVKDLNVICADVFKDGKTIFAADAIVNVGGLKIGFFGLETPETQTKVNPGLIQGVTFAAAEGTEKNLYEVAQAEVDKLSKKADIVICLGHLGVDAETLATGNASYDVYKKLNGLDFMIDGHSHTVMTSGANGEKIQSTGTAFENIGVIVIDNAKKAIVDNYLVETANLGQDSRILAIANRMIKAVDKEYGTPFAKTEVFLDGVKNNVRSKETNLGDLVTDSMVWSVLKGGNIDVDADHVVAITNGGGIRANLELGDISKKDVNQVLPFGNTIAVDYVTGAELLETLEASTYCTPATVGGFPQVAGIVFTINTKAEYDQGELYEGSTYYGPKSIKRVTIESVNGKPFDAKAKYAVITNNFCAAGGDTYFALKRAYDAGQGFDTSIELDLGLMQYIEEELGGTITSKYAAPQGRIIVK